MARIRTIKPEFPQSESMGRISRDARLLFIMLWTLVDDEGRTRAASRMLASLLYPYDDDAKTHIVQWMFELEREGCITLYDVDGNAYLQIEKWLSHQKIDHPTPSRLPAPVAKSREVSRSLAPDLVPSTVDLGKDLGPVVGPSQAKPEAKGKRRALSSLPENAPSEPDRNAALEHWASKGRQDLAEQLEDIIQAFRAHHTSHGKRMADWSAAWRTWYGNAVRFNRASAVLAQFPQAKIIKVA